MSRVELVRAVVTEQLDDPYELLAMRLLFPPRRIEVGIEREIKDLYIYPERLEASYWDEWRSIAIRALHDYGFADHWRTDRENLEQYVRYLRREAIPRCIHDHIDLFRSLGQVLQIGQSEKTVTFPDPSKRALMKIIWPERG